MATNGNFGQQEQYKGALEGYPSAPASNSATRAENESDKLTNDQVGWYFVEQYYTTLSKAPEKLHLFYGKQSQFVYGLEAEVANVSVGRQDIQERIKALDFQDCKVRVSNVDSQASMNNIVIQVIGETSNKGQEPKKFVQTFVLAQQPSGYFVLNDILRYINEDVEEETETEAPAPVDGPVEAPAAVEAEDPKTEAPALDTDAVAEKLEKTEDTPAVNGDAEETAPVKDDEAPAATEPAADADTAAKQVAEEVTKEAEKPQDPAPTPAAKPAAPEPAPTAPAEPAAPPKPMTWASRAAAAAGPRPVVPLPKTATPPAPAQNRAPAPAAPAAAPAAAATQPAAAPAATKEGSEWQTAGADSKRQNRPQSVSGNVTEKEGTMGYVKFVTDKVQDSDLKSALATHGELSYFDINRQKNCAFVEYKTTEGYNSAMAASPLTVNGENIVIEPRRPKANAYGGASYGSGRGGASGRGRGGYDGRSNNNSRGSFGGQGRGRGGASRGRGGAQATNA